MPKGNTLHVVMIAACLALAGCGNGTPAVSADAPIHEAPSSGDPAADLVRNFRMGANLEEMANEVAASTHTYATVSPTDVKAQISRLTPKYQAEWDANLAKAHAAHLSPEALRSLAAEGRRSPFYPKLEQQRPAIAADMKAASGALLHQLVRKALTSASRH